MINFAPFVKDVELKMITQNTIVESDALYTLWYRVNPWDSGRWMCEESLKVIAGQTWNQAYILKHEKMPDAKLICFLEEIETKCYYCGGKIKNLVQNHEFHQDGLYCSEDCLTKEMKMMESWQESL